MIRAQGIPVQWGITPTVCKLCKLYTEHLMKEVRGEPLENNNFSQNYRRRLFNVYKSEEAQRKKQRQAEADQQNRQPHVARTSSDGGVEVAGKTMPPPPDHQSPAKAALDQEASRALSRNPAISIRELFPGEDEMGLNVHFPFGQGSRTPEGWTRSYSLLQYDEATRQLWEELQRPYGNQSSFIRHLVLLEKYFRNGDLVLSKHASSSAATYSESVQTRIQAFDSVSTENRSLLKQLSNAPITITQTTAPKPREQPPLPKETGLPVPPLVPTSSLVSNAAAGGGGGPSGSAKVEAGVSLLRKSFNSLPPDLISITPKAPSAASSGAPMTAPTAVATTTASTSSAAATSPPSTAPAAVSPSKKGDGGPGKPIIVKLPDSLTPQERKLVNGKSWRPTLMPVEKIELNEDGSRTLFETADGRLLPSRVQVMSGGKPYHISIKDYNRMCILRREKLVQKAMATQSKQNKEQAAGGSAPVPTTTPVNSPPKTAVVPSGNVPALRSRSSSSGGAANNNNLSAVPTAPMVKPAVQIPDTVLEQNLLIPIPTSSALSITATNGTAAGGNKRRNSRAKEGVAVAEEAKGRAVAKPGNVAAKESIPCSPPKVSWMWNPGDLSRDVPFNPPTVIDDSAASLLSRIPKSLTVIPQQKLRVNPE